MQRSWLASSILVAPMAAQQPAAAVLGGPAGLLAHLSRLAPVLGAAALAVLSVTRRRVRKAA